MDRARVDPLASARGRPRSEPAREAVLHAADDLLVELGYEALTMKGIAERAGVGRQTVYRWWASKAEILFEACALDVARELALEPDKTAGAALASYIERLHVFLTDSDAGATYLALLGASQVDRAVADQLRSADPLRASAHTLVDALRSEARSTIPADGLAVAELVGAPVFQALSASDPLSRRFANEHLLAVAASWGISTNGLDWL
jgi:AcrR family transcriptional regulator